LDGGVEGVGSGKLVRITKKKIERLVWGFAPDTATYLFIDNKSKNFYFF